MRKLYWKIFLSFWLASILIILTTAWVTSEMARKSAVPAQEQAFMDSYAHAAVAISEAGHRSALIKWLAETGLNKQTNLFLLTSTGQIISPHDIPIIVKQISESLVKGELDEGLFKSGGLIVSHEIRSTAGIRYRLAAESEKPLSHFEQIPWAGLLVRFFIAIFISGLFCYLLSIYLTEPLRSMRLAAKSLATGKLSTRVGSFVGHHNDEIAELSHEFDRMAEQLEELINSKQRLLQDISHELRSPLARLQIAIELGRKKSNHLADGEFKRMEVECLRLNALIGEALEFARLDKSTNVLNIEMVHLPTLLEHIINDANFEYAKVTPRAIFGILEPCQLPLDQRLIHRAIENILRNALRYSPTDEPVTVSLYQALPEHQIHIDIEDHGPGVPEDQLAKIFDPFYRVDTAREKTTGGYGLGLAIAKKAIALHDGEIQAKNRGQGGLLVRVILPSPSLSTACISSPPFQKIGK